MSLPEMEALKDGETGYLESRLHIEDGLDRFRRMGTITQEERQELTNFLTNISVSQFTALSIAMYMEGVLINSEVYQEEE
jgi:hypothetical protein